MTATRTAAAAGIVRQRLDDGLDVIVRRVPGVAVVATCLQYDVGFRNEPVSGLAHLTEHLLAGPWSLDPAGTLELFASGGRTNARTSLDYTQYTHVVPRGALDLVLMREQQRARLRAPSARALAEQVDVVRAELRRNVAQRPHGGLVMFDLPPLLFHSFADAHNGYGDVGAIEALDPEVVRAFLTERYRARSAHLAVVGDLDPAETIERVRAALETDDRPHGSVSGAGSPLDMGSDDELPRVGSRTDPHARDARTAWGFRVPDPVAEETSYLALTVLCEVLDGGPGSSVPGMAPPTYRWRMNRNGNPFDLRPPGMLAVVASHPAIVPPEHLEEALRRLLASVTTRPDWPERVRRTLRLLKLTLLADVDSVVGQASWICIGAALRDDPDLHASLLARLQRLTADDVARAAVGLAAAPAARITSVPA